MTYEDVVIAALARTLDWDGEFPSARQPMYRRIGKRQQQLFTMASKINPDYWGTCAIATIDPTDLNVDLRLLDGGLNVDQSVGVQRIEIQDEGTSSLTSGDQVHIVSINDRDAELAPRVTIRDLIIASVGTDLTGVTSLAVYYPRYPDMPATSEDGTTALELQQAHDELLVIDLTKDLVRKTLSMDPATKTAIQGLLDAEEKEALGPYLDDVGAFAVGQAHRFSEPRPTSTR